MKTALAAAALIFCLLLSACFADQGITGDLSAPEGDRQEETVSIQTEAGKGEELFTSIEETKREESVQPEDQSATPISTPTRDEVYSARAVALAGMSDENIVRLTDIISGANHWWEMNYLYDHIFDDLSDPDNLHWNIFHQTGLVQIGWALEDEIDMKAVCAEENLTTDDFYEKYASPVSAYNDYTADMFIDMLKELQETVVNDDLDSDLQYVIDELALARDTHDVEYVNNMYKTLHDMDYFLLRYYSDVYAGSQMDFSTVSKYYGVLSIYQQ